MVKLAKGVQKQGKVKKAAPPPPKDVEDSEEEDSEEEEDDSEEEEEVPQQKKAITPAKASATPGKKAATPAKKAATPAKPVTTPGKKGAAAKNGKKAQKEESEDDDDDDDEEEDDEDESESEDEAPPPKKPTPKKPETPKAEKQSAKKKAAKKEDSDEEEDEESDEAMDTTPPPPKAKAAVPSKAKASAATAESDDDEEEEEDDDDDDDDEDDDEDDDDDEEKVVKESGKRKKELPKKKSAPEAKKQKTEQKTEGTETGFSLYLGNLNPEKDFDELKDAIRQFFAKKNLTVSDVRIGGSKKFGYVDFSTEADLEKAVNFNGKKILGLETKMERARTKEGNLESKKERSARTVFVKNLPYSTTTEDLQDIFKNAVDIRLPLGHDGSSRGIAYLEFKTEAEADKVIEEKQGTEVDGRSILLDYTGEKSAKRGSDSKTLLVNNLSYNATESSLQEVFEKAVSVRIPQNNQGRPKGFAFIEFSTAEEAKEALDSHNNTEIEGRSIRLEMQNSQGANARGGGQTKTLFVKGLSEDTTEESLKEAFDGAVGSRIATDRDTGASKGFGFVDFSTVEDAKAAKAAMEDGEIDGNKVTLDFAKPKGEGGRGWRWRRLWTRRRRRQRLWKGTGLWRRLRWPRWWRTRRRRKRRPRRIWW
ncbi:hypothetical protein NDU88_000456 [Pleurodeles waltl]|uniref:Nucleolin n=1 Tax=Pleurodeles waltl TaxID=8319 RepID=A0AAV7L6J3_PLEWA|nr:hypothetical protein NDU88_000456 [Pleurodeles waltl]